MDTGTWKNFHLFGNFVIWSFLCGSLVLLVVFLTLGEIKRGFYRTWHSTMENFEFWFGGRDSYTLTRIFSLHVRLICWLWRQLKRVCIHSQRSMWPAKRHVFWFFFRLVPISNKTITIANCLWVCNFFYQWVIYKSLYALAFVGSLSTNHAVHRYLSWTILNICSCSSSWSSLWNFARFDFKWNKWLSVWHRLMTSCSLVENSRFLTNGHQSYRVSKNIITEPGATRHNADKHSCFPVV